MIAHILIKLIIRQYKQNNSNNNAGIFMLNKVILIGSINNNKDEQVIEINVIAENNRSRTYTLNIKRLDKLAS